MKITSERIATTTKCLTQLSQIVFGSFHLLLNGIQQLCRHHNRDDVILAEHLVTRAEDCDAVLQAVLDTVLEGSGGSVLNESVQDLASLIQVVDHPFCYELSPLYRQSSVTGMSSTTSNL